MGGFAFTRKGFDLTENGRAVDERCTECCEGERRYLEARVCPGFPGTPRRVFVLVELVDGCYTFSQNPPVNAITWCYTVFPGISRTFTESEALALGGVLIGADGGTLPPQTRGKTCCSCGNNQCTETTSSYDPHGATPPGTMLPLGPCCCSNDRRVTTNIRKEAYRRSTPADPSQDFTSLRVEQAVAVFRGPDYDFPVSVTGQGTYTYTSAAGTSTQTYAYSGEWPRCTPSVDYSFIRNRTDVLVSNGVPYGTSSYTSIVTRDCFTFDGTQIHAVDATDPNTGVRVESGFTDRFLVVVQPEGICGGGCPGASGAGGASGGLLAAPGPLPRSQWPAWARVASWARAESDRGLGDTLRRTIGEENSAAFKAFWFQLFGTDCGCDGRQAEWNAIYRY